MCQKVFVFNIDFEQDGLGPLIPLHWFDCFSVLHPQLQNVSFKIQILDLIYCSDPAVSSVHHPVYLTGKKRGKEPL